MFLQLDTRRTSKRKYSPRITKKVSSLLQPLTVPWLARSLACCLFACMPPKTPPALLTLFFFFFRPQSQQIISECARRRAPESIVERLCKWSSFLLVLVWGDVAALVVSPLQKTTKPWIIVDLSLLSLRRACCVCGFCVFVRAAGCMRRSHRESIAHVLSACISVSARSSALTPFTRGLQLWAFIPLLIIVICGVHCEGTRIFISLEKWRNITSPVSDFRVLFVLLRCFSFSAQHKIRKLNRQTLERVMWALHESLKMKSFSLTRRESQICPSARLMMTHFGFCCFVQTHHANAWICPVGRAPSPGSCFHSASCCDSELWANESTQSLLEQTCKVQFVRFFNLMAAQDVS